MIQIETIQNTKYIKEIINDTNDIINISFDVTSSIIFDNFINLNNSQKEIYTYKNYKVGIDIVENYFDIYLFLIDCIEIANIKINNSFYVNLIKPLDIWNLCICEDIMFNYPFTMEKYIYMPLKYIIDCFINNGKNKIITTLIHEKIHISQRYNEILWDEFILKNNKKWIKIYSDNSIFFIVKNNINNNLSIINSDKYKFIINPDSDYENFIYIYNVKDKYYYGHYVFEIDSGKISILFFDIDIKNNILKYTKNFNITNEHPYEEFAYKISEEIMNK